MLRQLSYQAPKVICGKQRFKDMMFCLKNAETRTNKDQDGFIVRYGFVIGLGKTRRDAQNDFKGNYMDNRILTPEGLKIVVKM